MVYVKIEIVGEICHNRRSFFWRSQNAEKYFFGCSNCLLIWRYFKSYSTCNKTIRFACDPPPPSVLNLRLMAVISFFYPADRQRLLSNSVELKHFLLKCPRTFYLGSEVVSWEALAESEEPQRITAKLYERVGSWLRNYHSAGEPAKLAGTSRTVCRLLNCRFFLVSMFVCYYIYRLIPHSRNKHCDTRTVHIWITDQVQYYQLHNGHSYM